MNDRVTAEAEMESGAEDGGGLSAVIRDQLTGLGWAAALAGALLTLLEVPILGLEEVGRVLPYTLTALVLGAGLLFWLEQYRGLGWLLGIFGAWLAGAIGAVSDSAGLALLALIPELAGVALFVRQRHWYDLCWLGIADGLVDLLVRLGSAEGFVVSAQSLFELLPLALGVGGLVLLTVRASSASRGLPAD